MNFLFDNLSDNVQTQLRIRQLLIALSVVLYALVAFALVTVSLAAIEVVTFINDTSSPWDAPWVNNIQRGPVQ